MRSSVFLLLFWFCCPFLLHSEELTLLSITKDDFDGLKKETRAKYVKLLLAEVESIFTALPNLSPDQERWLTAERERIHKQNDPQSSVKSLEKLIASKEYRLRLCKNAFRNMRTLLEGMEQVEKNNKPSFHAWVWLAVNLTDAETFEDLEWLRGQGEITLPKDAYTLTTQTMANIVGREILKKIVFENVRKLETQK